MRGVSSSLAAVVAVVGLVVGILAGYGVALSTIQPQTISITQTVTQTVTEEMAMEAAPSIFVADQEIMDGNVIINQAYLDKPGYIVIHQVKLDGKPGKVIGRSDLISGKVENIKIKVEDYLGRGELIAMLHYDNGDGRYEFPGPDNPVKVAGVIAQVKFKVIQTVPSIAVSDQEIMDGWVTIDGLYLDKPGYVAIHLVTEEGKPGKVIGFSGLLFGQLERVKVKVEGYEGQKELIAMLHYDNGDGVYEFPGPDGPVKIDDKIVMVKFSIMMGGM